MGYLRHYGEWKQDGNKIYYCSPVDGEKLVSVTCEEENAVFILNQALGIATDAAYTLGKDEAVGRMKAALMEVEEDG